MFATLLAIAIACYTTTEAEAVEYRTVRIAPTNEILFNPGMGLYMAGGDNMSYQPTADAWPLTVSDIIYFRPTWNDLEADGPGTNLAAYFDPIFDFWVKQQGKRVAFRVMSASTHARGNYATPQWVFGAGAGSVEHQNLYGQTQTDPIFWDDQYLDAYVKFVQRLGAYLDGREGLEFVDIGGIGEWGEMHLGLHMPGRWTQQQLDAAGFTRDRYIAAYRRAIDAHAMAFANTRVFLNVGDYAEINDYAALRGCHFRQDGLKPSGPSADVGRRFYRSYSPRGVLCNYEFHSGYHSMQEKGWDLRETIEAGLSDPISYLNTNIMSPASWETAPGDVKALFEDAARRVGYRFVMTQIRVPKRIQLRRGARSRLLVEHHWKNVGAAPCHESYAIEFTLHDAENRQLVRHVHYPQTPTSAWRSGEAIVERTLIRLPEQMPTGQLQLKAAMLDPASDDAPVLLGIAGRDAARQYLLCKLESSASTSPSGPVYMEGFEGNEHGWTASQGMSLEIDDGVAHNGGASLLLEGRQQGEWNYAAHTLARPVLPGSRYRLSCWIRMDELDPHDKSPYLKIGLTDSDDRWIANLNTGRCDPDQMGQWQRLEATIETSLDAAGGHLALERGEQEKPTSVKLWIDDIKLELLESP